MEYEPIKKQIGRWVRRSVLLRKLLYRLLGTLFLREWYVKRAIRRLGFPKTSAPRILDAGAGFGQYSVYCIKKYPRADVLGIEINPDHVAEGNRFAQRAGLERLRFEHGDITKLSHRNRFDVVLAVDVLEHIQDDEALLDHFFRALTVDGRLIVSTPSVYRKHRPDGNFVGEHFREGYSEEGIRQKLDKAGFLLDTLTYGYGFWGDLSWRWGIRNTLTLMGRGFLGKIAGPVYMILVAPLVLSLMGLDYVWPNRRGTGFVIVARKPA
jgi:SAM-dependent methyltransferase